MSAFFPEVFFKIFGAQDWAFYLLSQIFVLIAFYFVFKLSFEVLGNIKLSLISVLLLESIYFYNFTTPEFNVNVCQLPFWSLVVYFTWKIYETKEIKFSDCFFIGLFAAIGFLSKYLFIYLLISFLIYLLLNLRKNKKILINYFLSVFISLIILIPHFFYHYLYLSFQIQIKFQIN